MKRNKKKWVRYVSILVFTSIYMYVRICVFTSIYMYVCIGII